VDSCFFHLFLLRFLHILHIVSFKFRFPIASLHCESVIIQDRSAIWKEPCHCNDSFQKPVIKTLSHPRPNYTYIQGAILGKVILCTRHFVNPSGGVFQCQEMMWPSMVRWDIETSRHSYWIYVNEYVYRFNHRGRYMVSWCMQISHVFFHLSKILQHIYTVEHLHLRTLCHSSLITYLHLPSSTYNIWCH